MYKEGVWVQQKIRLRIHCAKSDTSIKAYTLALVHTCLGRLAADDDFVIYRNASKDKCLCSQADV